MVRREIEDRAREVAEDLQAYTPRGFTSFLGRLGKALDSAFHNNHRVLLVLSGSDPVGVGASTARALLYFEKRYRKRRGRRERLDLLYVFHDEYEDALTRKEITRKAVKSKAKLLKQTTARYERSEQYLGTTFQALVLDLTNDLKPNDVGRLTGTVEGGGIIVVQAPRWTEWDTMMTIFKQNLLVPGFDEPRHIFISWFKRKLLAHKLGVYVYDVDKGKLLSGEPEPKTGYKKKTVRPPEKSLFPDKLYRLALTQDQADAIRELEWFYEKPPRGKKKILVLTADRGRGKSCAVGIGLIGFAYLLRKHKHRVRMLVTAPSLDSVQSLFQLALKAAETLGLKPSPVRKGNRIIEIQGDKFSLEYWEPLTIPRLSADIVAVDEASGIHVPLLHKIWRSHRRIVFATTIHGYEGAGRGFSVRFLKTLKESPEAILHTREMHEPIRYSSGDPVEAWLFDTLLLDADPAALDEDDLEDIREGRLRYLELDPYWLFSPEGEDTLRTLFGIYVLAHYRNEPDDLAILADAPHHIVRAVVTERKGRVVSAVQAAVEGGLEDHVVESLLRGDKIPGNIIPDRLLKHLRVREFGKMRGVRIVRIATHPDVQIRGIGSFMLSKMYEETVRKGFDWLGSGFGVNEQLLRFWTRNGFSVLHISPDRNPVSGEYTILVLKPISSTAETLIRVGVVEFKKKLLMSLYDTYRDLELDVAYQMLHMEPPIETGKPRLGPIELDRLWIYSYGPMTYEAANDLAYRLALAYYMQAPRQAPRLSREHELILLAKVLQAKSWEETAGEVGVHRHKVMIGLREAIRGLARAWYGLSEERGVGIGVEEVAGERGGVDGLAPEDPGEQEV